MSSDHLSYHPISPCSYSHIHGPDSSTLSSCFSCPVLLVLIPIKCCLYWIGKIVWPVSFQWKCSIFQAFLFIVPETFSQFKSLGSQCSSSSLGHSLSPPVQTVEKRAWASSMQDGQQKHASHSSEGWASKSAGVSVYWESTFCFIGGTLQWCPHMVQGQDSPLWSL